MKFWDQILNTALLGTDKKQVSLQDSPDPVKKVQEFLNKEEALDKEDKFLHLAALAYNYRQCGRIPFPHETQKMAISDPEIKSYCSSKSFQVLKDILAEDNSIPLLRFWLKQCMAADQVVHPEIIPDLFQIATLHKSLRNEIAQVSGKRGEWLKRFNATWQFPPSTDQNESWQTGTNEERKNIIKRLRMTEPQRARELLTECWDKENANTKTEFLKLFDGNVNSDDREWIESLQIEKSSKLRDEVMNLLKQLPGSSVVELYWQVLQKAVTLKKGKALLGIMNKTSLSIDPPTHPEESLAKTGIEKLSNNKNFSDEEFSVYQMMHFIPPSYWEKHFAERPDQIIPYFQKEKSLIKYLPALSHAIARFRDQHWAIAFVQHIDFFQSSIVHLIPARDQELYSLRHFEENPEEVIQCISTNEMNWSAKIGKFIFSYAARNPYKYNRSFFSEHVEHIPEEIQSALAGTNPSEEHLLAQWIKTSDHILKLYSIKQETIKAFKK